MDKYDKVLDMIEHPDKYSADQLKAILADTETREIYNILCKTDSAAEANKEIDVDAEWDKFARKQGLSSRRLFGWIGSRAASIAVIVCTSLAAVAAGIAVTVAVTERDIKSDASEEAGVEIHTVDKIADSSAIQPDSVTSAIEPIMFEDASLETIMKAIADAYNIEVKFNNKEAAALHLYYKLDTSLPLVDIISQLNTFEQIRINLKDNILTID